ncbi:cell division control protein 31-like [Bombus vosnesenskii]|uniref:Cell division control protein 31-like n=2 Tax=Pyrobombus TaxID=144703 RepID=A0A6J3LNP0_9HYME|nr:cell division control protein 31-like [Bombus impatiens]XP_033201700.1 cell division control protein 31-like [Bombus vancouverensis nearcticus]XP_033367027.1 cell division control protein 31-like [Bombus vosnesenskii]
MSTITKNVRTENLKRRLKESFCLMDTDTDGYLDYHEMKAALKALGFAVKKSYILSIIRMYDKRGYNKICFEDFNYIVSEKLNKRKPLDEIKYVFKLFTNETANDKITVEDLQKLNKKLDCNLTNEEMELMIKEFDLDQDGSSKTRI